MVRPTVCALLCVAALVLVSMSCIAAPLAPCNASFTSCGIQEDVLLQLPFTAISGDVILLDPHTTVVSDVFRIFNNLVNTGLGTGFGNMVFLYSSDDSTPLPLPSTYSANAVTIMEDPSGITHFVGNGTDYLLGVPEPCTFGFVTLGTLLVAGLVRRRRIP